MDYVNFLKSYGGLILAGLTVLLSIISLILRKKKIVIEDSFLDGIYSFAIQLIQEAERRFKIGSEKKAFVVSGLKEKYPTLSKYLDGVAFGNSFKDQSSDIYGYIVENILSTPQKKGGR